MPACVYEIFSYLRTIAPIAMFLSLLRMTCTRVAGNGTVNGTTGDAGNTTAKVVEKIKKVKIPLTMDAVPHGVRSVP